MSRWTVGVIQAEPQSPVLADIRQGGGGWGGGKGEEEEEEHVELGRRRVSENSDCSHHSGISKTEQQMATQVGIISYDSRLYSAVYGS